jgi:chromosome segregation ATPase
MGRHARPGGSFVRTVRILVAIVFFTCLLPANREVLAQQDHSQSGTGDPVADAARKAREQKKSAPKPKKVFTNDDIAPKSAAEPPPAQQAAPAPVSEEAASTEAATSKEDAAKKEDPNSEAAWRKRFAAQRKKIADAEQELDVLQREAEKLDVQYYSDPQKAMNEQYSRKEINEKTDKIAAKKKELADLKQQFSDMEDELRRTGGDPGWAR